MISVTTRSPEETIAFAERIGKMLRGGDIIAYRGGLGAGKTAFTRGVALGLGLPDEVSSPTFALVNEYRGKGITLYHFDMYRILNAEALETTGFYDYISEDAVVACEWSENIADCLPPDVITVTIETIGETVRKITVTGDERFDNSWD
ncbi:MAG: tRNA (adenosine(37)-N6)-threonylcarbamoyltransferase complex ATPase subunit type 1 TsaE [Prevotella sp.]|nr:tRNA (adenosine(37)-N6)-threonylcarbamoyltransferase complex ATPase subunit type 1 TsaE [Prevotella sp.]